MPSASPRRAESPADSERYVIPNLRNACRILKLLGRQPDGLKAAELARALGIPVTTTLRIMATLHLEGLARKSDGRFGLGPVLIQLGTAALDGVELRTLAQPLLQKLSAATDETALLATRPAMVDAIRAAFTGLVRATLARTENGTWIDVFYWEDRAAADRAIAGESTLPAYQAFAAHIGHVASSEIADVPEQEVPEGA